MLADTAYQLGGLEEKIVQLTYRIIKQSSVITPKALLHHKDVSKYLSLSWKLETTYKIPQMKLLVTASVTQGVRRQIAFQRGHFQNQRNRCKGCFLHSKFNVWFLKIGLQLLPLQVTCRELSKEAPTPCGSMEPSGDLGPPERCPQWREGLLPSSPLCDSCDSDRQGSWKRITQHLCFLEIAFVLTLLSPG